MTESRKKFVSRDLNCAKSQYIKGKEPGESVLAASISKARPKYGYGRRRVSPSSCTSILRSSTSKNRMTFKILDKKGLIIENISEIMDQSSSADESFETSHVVSSNQTPAVIENSDVQDERGGLQRDSDSSGDLESPETNRACALSYQDTTRLTFTNMGSPVAGNSREKSLFEYAMSTADESNMNTFEISGRVDLCSTKISDAGFYSGAGTTPQDVNVECLLQLDSSDRSQIPSGIARKQPTFLGRLPRGERNLYCCSFCKKPCHTSNQKEVHEAAVHKKERLKCPRCDKTFAFPRSLETHFRGVHLEEKRFKCTICSKEYFRLDDMKAHSIVHKPENRLKCPHCPLTYSLKGSLTAHIKQVHLKQGKECEICGKQFPFESSLKRHIRLVHLERHERLNLEQEQVTN